MTKLIDYGVTTIVNRISANRSWVSFEKDMKKIKFHPDEAKVLYDMIEFPLDGPRHKGAMKVKWMNYLKAVNKHLNSYEKNLSLNDITRDMQREGWFGGCVKVENLEIKNCGALIRCISGQKELECGNYFNYNLPYDTYIDIDPKNGVHYHIFNTGTFGEKPTYEIQLTLRSKISSRGGRRKKRKTKTKKVKRVKTKTKRTRGKRKGNRVKTRGKRKGNRVKTRRKWMVRKKKTRKGRRG